MDINQLCEKTTNPTMLNALHACREGHPLNGLDGNPWLNAWALATQQGLTFSHAEISWLYSKYEETL